PGSEVVLRLTVASDCTDTEVRAPSPWYAPRLGAAPPAAGDAAAREYRKPTWP
ncbi:hypothetical protein I552_8573, partial [Mycobacterium xenopi 3993]